MKAVNKTSIFAIAALTTAISAQTFAEDMPDMPSMTSEAPVTTEAAATDDASPKTVTSIEYAGSMEVHSIMDLEAETRASGMDMGDDYFGLSATTTITHGPISGTIKVEVADFTGAVVIGEDIIVTDGSISFGQVGSVVNTQQYISEDEQSELAHGVLAGFRYTNEAAGIKIQGEGGNGVDFGAAAAFEKAFGNTTLLASAQYREDGAQTALDSYYGVAATTSIAEMLTLKGNYSAKGDMADYGARADLTITDSISAYGYMVDYSEAQAKEMFIKAGFSAGFGLITVEGNYITQKDTNLAADGKLSFTQDSVTAYVDFVATLLEGAEYTSFGAGAAYTSPVGIVYAADFDGGESAVATTQSTVKVAASYSF